MNLAIDPKELDLQTIVADAVMRSLSAERREFMIRDAIAYLMTVENSGYGGGRRSPLGEAFRRAVQDVAQGECERMMSEDADVLAKIRSMVTDAVAAVTTENREHVVKSMAQNLTDWMTRDQ